MTIATTTSREDNHADLQERHPDRERADEWFTGAVFVDALTSPSEDQHINASNVHFAPGARTAWHAHPHGQTIWITNGVGLVQRRGGPVEVVTPGDRVFFEPNEDHWHGAAPDRLMTHLSMVEVRPGEDAATWGDHVTDDEYNTTPTSNS